MAFSADVIKKVKDEFDNKRKAAQALAEKRRAELHSRFEEIAQIDSVLATTGLRVFNVAINGGDVNAEIERMREENNALREMRSNILKQAGIESDYSDVKYECTLCNDTGYIDIEPCECFKKAVVKESFLSAGLGSVLKNQCFDNFKLEYYSTAKNAKGVSPRENMSYILKEARAYAEGFSKTDSHDNLFFFGSTGLGKTHISTAIARRVIEDGASVIYDTAQNIMHAFEARTFSGNHDVDTDKYMLCDLLIIDDLGAEFKNSYTLSVLYNILNTRICSGKPVIISTNFDSLEAISKAYDARITSRLLGEFRAFMFVGDDIRLTKKLKQ